MTTTPLRSLPLLAAALLAVGCAPDFTSPSQVASLRVLAVRAEPPELAPPAGGAAPARAALDALIAHPGFATDAARRATVLHLACTPSLDPAAADPCTSLTELAAPAALLGAADLAPACAAPGLGRPGALTLAGVASCGRDGCGPATVLRDPADAGSEVTLPAPAYEVPAALDLTALPAGDPRRALGVEAVDLVLALDAAPAELAPAAAAADGCAALAAVGARFAALWDARPHVAALKRIRVRGPEAASAPNLNPVVSAIAAGGQPLPAPAAGAAEVPGQAGLELAPVLPDEADALRQAYVELDASGAPLGDRTEEWVYAWFTSAGTMHDQYTRRAAETASLTAPGDGPALVWVVVRDQRGGVAFASGALRGVP